ncbi:MAG: calcium-binding protein [Planctomycetota bacterium]
MIRFKYTNRTTRNKRNRQRRKLRPEMLQKREMMAGDYVDSVVDNTTGEMQITGTDGAESVHVFIDDRGTADTSDDIVQYRTTYADGTEITAGQRQYYNDGSLRVKSLRFEGFGGNDKFFNRTDYDSIAFGGAGDDFLSGSSGVDEFYGELGNDRLHGHKGKDVLNGGSGNDFLSGSLGDDELIGGSGNDWLGGGSGDDYLRGGSGNDWMYGSFGDDDMYGNSGRDKMYGGFGNDMMLGGSGDDNMNGNQGNDTLMGQSGKDLMQGNAGDDFMYGGSDNDTMYGNTGNDLMAGGDGRDLVSGNQDNDRIYGGEMRGLNLNHPGYGNPTLHKKSDAQDWDKDILAGGEGTDWFGIANNGIFSDDKVMDHESGEIIRDLDPWGATAGTGQVFFAGNYGHQKDD